MLGPHRLDDWLEDRQRHSRTGLARAERAPAIGIVVTHAYRNRDIIGEADEPDIVFAVARPGLASHVRGETSDRAGSSAMQNALQHGLELIEGSAVCGCDFDHLGLMEIDDFAIPFDGFDCIRRRTDPFVGNSRIESREVDRPHWLGAEHERTIGFTLAVDSRLTCQPTDAVETAARFALNTAIEEIDCREILGVFQCAA